MKNGHTPYFNRFGVDYDGPHIPMGAEIEYYPIRDKDKHRLHQLGPKTLPGIFVGYDTQAGGNWSEDLIIVDWDEMDRAERVSEITTKRFHHKEIRPIMTASNQFKFPLIDGELNQPGLSFIEKRRIKDKQKHKSQIQQEEEESTVAPQSDE